MNIDPKSQDQIRKTLESDMGKTLASLRAEQSDALTQFVRDTLTRQTSSAKPPIDVTKTTTQLQPSGLPLPQATAAAVPPGVGGPSSGVTMRYVDVTGGSPTTATATFLTQ